MACSKCWICTTKKIKVRIFGLLYLPLILGYQNHVANLFSGSSYCLMMCLNIAVVTNADPDGYKFVGKETETRKKKVREKSRVCHNHKPQPFPDTKRKRKPTNPNHHKSNKRTKSTKISSLFPKRGNRNAKRTENTRTKWHKVRHKTNRLVE